MKPSSVRGLADRHAALLTDGEYAFVKDAVIPYEEVMPFDSSGEAVARRALKLAVTPWGDQIGNPGLAQDLVRIPFDYSFTCLGTRYHVALVPTLSQIQGFETTPLPDLLTDLQSEVDVTAIGRLLHVLERENARSTALPVPDGQRVSIVSNHAEVLKSTSSDLDLGGMEMVKSMTMRTQDSTPA